MQFSLYDKDKNGSITQNELQEVLTKMGEPLPEESIRQLVASVDKNKDGQITFEEFQTIFDLIAKMKTKPTATKDAKAEKPPK